MRLNRTFVAAAILAGVSGSVFAGVFSSGNLVVMKVSTANGAVGSGAISLDEFSLGGAAAGNTISIDGGISLPNAQNHDRHLHRSTDGRFLSFAAYAAAPSASDPSTFSAAAVNRVVGIVGQDGSVDTSTRLNNNYNNTTIRGAFTTNGTDIWLAGDNGGDTTTSGGLRFTTRGSSTSNNLSRTQVNGGTPQADNVRDAGVYGGQLFDSSGSGSSIGKGVLQVGSGTPTSGAQSLIPVTTVGGTGFNVSTSSFYFLDLNAAIPGVDTLYSATDNGVRKYVLGTTGTWSDRGIAGNASGNAFEQVIAQANADGSVSVFAAGAAAVNTFTDPNGTSGSITGLASSNIISAPAGFSLGGISFSPVPAPGVASVLALAGLMARRRSR